MNTGNIFLNTQIYTPVIYNKNIKQAQPVHSNDTLHFTLRLSRGGRSFAGVASPPVLQLVGAFPVENEGAPLVLSLVRGGVVRLLAVARQVDVLVEESHRCKENGKSTDAGSKEEKFNRLETNGKGSSRDSRDILTSTNRYMYNTYNNTIILIGTNR